MKKFALIALCLLMAGPAYADNYRGGYRLSGAQAKDIDTSTANFDNNLSSADNTVQKALETLDELSAGGAPEGTAVLSTGEVGGTKFLREDGDGTSSWQTVPAPEGTAILSTGETGGTKFLREDGDGTSSWQTVSAGAPSDATYITQTANGTLSAEQALSSLSTGAVTVTTGTGVLSSVAPSTSGNVMLSNGSAWTSAASGAAIASSGGPLSTLYTNSAWYYSGSSWMKISHSGSYCYFQTNDGPFYFESDIILGASGQEYNFQARGTLTFGATDLGGKVNIDGSANEVQLWVQGHSTQTNDLALFEKSDGTDVVRITNSNLLLTPVAVGSLGTATAGGVAMVSDATDATDCTVGSGSTYNLCIANGSAWIDA